MKNSLILQIFFGFFAICFLSLTEVSTHKHSFGKERLEDGAFSPRDHMHYDNQGSQYFLFSFRRFKPNNVNKIYFRSSP